MLLSSVDVEVHIPDVFLAGEDFPLSRSMRTLARVMKTVFITVREGRGMSEISFEELSEKAVFDAPQDPTTHALVQNPFAWDETDGSAPSEQ